ncbi:hypothetical protein D5273_00600 [Enterorhabdus caecimuris]|nr:hypothetical protein [Adlercreutzia caecimuris]
MNEAIERLHLLIEAELLFIGGFREVAVGRLIRNLIRIAVLHQVSHEVPAFHADRSKRLRVPGFRQGKERAAAGERSPQPARR